MLFQDTFFCSYTTLYHRVANAANAFDLDFHDIPVMQKERGSAFEPTPDGVPVAMISPGSRVMRELRKAIVEATEKTILAVVSCCTTCSFTLVVSMSVWGLGMLDARTIPGPIGAKVSTALPAVHLLVCICTSRALTSFL